jgi:hypothetical protein
MLSSCTIIFNFCNNILSVYWFSKVNIKTVSIWLILAYSQNNSDFFLSQTYREINQKHWCLWQKTIRLKYTNIYNKNE